MGYDPKIVEIIIIITRLDLLQGIILASLTRDITVFLGVLKFCKGRNMARLPKAVVAVLVSYFLLKIDKFCHEG